MLVKILFLSLLIFGVTYPLCFWISFKDPIKNHFLRFHLGCPVFLVGLALMGLQFSNGSTGPSMLLGTSTLSLSKGSPLVIDGHLKLILWVWFVCALLLTAYFWNKETVHLGLVTLLCLWGIKLYALFYSSWVAPVSQEIALSILGGLIVSAVFYAMNLGHFYLNVHGLKLHHLKNAVRGFGALLLFRLCWNIYGLMALKTMYGGEQISLMYFMATAEGVFLWVALFFGVLFPLGSLYFIFGTLKLKNTQATTGLLYVVLSALLLGDLAYKYYLLKHSIPL